MLVAIPGAIATLTSARPFTVIVFVLVSSAFVVNTLVGSPRSSLMGLGLLLLGVPFYLRWEAPAARARREAAER